MPDTSRHPRPHYPVAGDRGTGPGLRPIPGGYDIDRLPITVARQIGELPESWLQRTAHRYGLHPRAMLTALGLHVRPQQRPLLPDLFHTPPGAKAATLLGLDPATVTHTDPLTTALHQARTTWDPRPVPRSRSARGARGAKWCPPCLAATGIWRHSWSEPLHVVCTEHDTILIERCPACDTVAYAAPAWTTSLDDPLACPGFVHTTSPDGGRYRSRCAHRLDHVPPSPAPPGAATRQAQIHDLFLTAATAPDTLVPVCGTTARAQAVAEGVLEMLHPHQPHPTAPAAGPAQRLTWAGDALAAPDLTHAWTLAHDHHLLPEYATRPVLDMREDSRTRQQAPLLVAMHLSSLRGRYSPSLELRFRTGSPRPCHPARWQHSGLSLHPGDDLDPVPVSWLPQLIWPGALGLSDAHDLGLDTPTGRAFTSMCLALYGSTREWRQVATALALPARTAQTIARTWSTIRRAERVPDFLRAIDTLFHRLHRAPPPIDYERRRIISWDPHDLQAALPATGRQHEPTGLHEAALTRLWARYTGGHEPFAPPAYHQLAPTSSDDHTLDALTEHWASLLPGPLTWTPP